MERLRSGEIMDKRLSRRLDKIEKKLKPEKGHWLRFPDGEGGFIEVPGCDNVMDVIALVGIRKVDHELDETERK